MTAGSLPSALSDLVDDFAAKGGRAGVPTPPGLGVKLTSEIIEKYRFVPSSGERT